MKHPESALSAWLAAAEVYRRPRMAAMLLLGFSAGLPFALVAGTLAAWLTVAGVSMADVGMFAWVGILYAFKFAWAPLVDQVQLPGLAAKLGRRRSWMLVSQLGVAAALLAMSFVDPASRLGLLALLAILAAFSSATQDIVIDAWRIEAAPTVEQGAMAAAYQLGYRLALLAATAGALLLGDQVSWPLAYQVMAALMAVGIVTTLVIREPEPLNQTARMTETTIWQTRAWIDEAVVQPFTDFFRRNGANALLILVFIGIYRVSDMVLGVMANPFYLDIGFTGTQIAGYAKTVGFAAVIGGAAVGGIAVARFGVAGPLVFGAVILALTNLAFAGLAVAGPDVPLLILTISADNLAQGFTGTVFIAYLSGLTNVSYTATQYALFTSLMVLPGKVLSGFSGLVVEAIGWVSFFVYAALVGVPAIWLATRVNRWFASERG
ncbi:MAG: MFS transporter [Wenzhouxiangella sp.]|jgi:PAT family beta-lactamase induction signal transducer AmpG|nr:MFS transporter [Wenzhouxiangella sp.]